MFTMSDEAMVRAVNDVRWAKFCGAVDGVVDGGGSDEEKLEKLVEWYRKREAGAEETSEVRACEECARSVRAQVTGRSCRWCHE